MFRNKEKADMNPRKSQPRPSSQRTLKKRAISLDPVLQLGKKGITDSMIAEINKQFRIRKLLKIKLLRSAIEGKSKKDIAEEIAEKTGAKLVGLTGFVATFYKETKESQWRR